MNKKNGLMLKIEKTEGYHLHALPYSTTIFHLILIYLRLVRLSFLSSQVMTSLSLSLLSVGLLFGSFVFVRRDLVY